MPIRNSVVAMSTPVEMTNVVAMSTPVEMTNVVAMDGHHVGTH